MLQSVVALKWVVWIAGTATALGGGLGLLALGTPFHFSHRQSSVIPSSDVALLDPLVVNLSDGRYLRIRLGVELENRQAGVRLQQYKVRLNDALMVALSNHNRANLQTPLGKRLLREEVQQKIQATIPELAVRSVYFVEFLVHL
jgi:flagellar basal body-associated protein FliL